METQSVVNSDEQLLAVLAMLEECRAALVTSGNRDTAHLVAVAVLDVRMKLSRITDDELIALCEEMMPNEIAAEDAREGGPAQAPRRPPLLRLVK